MVAMAEGGRWEDREWAQGLGVGGSLKLDFGDGCTILKTSGFFFFENFYEFI